ncbi:MAG TPA: DJ-1/PfpI family protein [Bryobacteraceae bacterium]|nr:DJ-1/PfpI family protein [Bryobacteraceae bacterium]
MEIGALIFPNIDQMDFTGPFEVLSRLRGARIHVFSKSLTPIRDTAGLILTPTVTLAEAPPLDVLLVPGGRGQLALMDDGEVLEFLAKPVSWIFSVCTGALTCGAAGLLKGKRATTHWNSFHLLPYFGAIPVDERVVIDGNLITTAGVSAGIDGALRLATLLGGEAVARRIQLDIQYVPEPPFALTPGEFLEAKLQQDVSKLTSARVESAKLAAARLGIDGIGIDVK